MKVFKLLLFVVFTTAISVQTTQAFWSRITNLAKGLKPAAAKLESSLELQKAVKGLAVKTGLLKFAQTSWSFIKQSTLARFLGYGATAASAADIAIEKGKKNSATLGVTTAAVGTVAVAHGEQSETTLLEKAKKKALAAHAWYKTNKPAYKQKALNGIVITMANNPNKQTDWMLTRLLMKQQPGYVQGSSTTCITRLLRLPEFASAVTRIATQPETISRVPHFMRNQLMAQSEQAVAAYKSMPQLRQSLLAGPRNGDRQEWINFHDRTMSKEDILAAIADCKQPKP